MPDQELARAIPGSPPHLRRSLPSCSKCRSRTPREGCQRLIDDIGRGPTGPVRPPVRFSILMRTLA